MTMAAAAPATAALSSERPSVGSALDSALSQYKRAGVTSARYGVRQAKKIGMACFQELGRQMGDNQ